MGHKVIQKNYECAICGHKAEDGEAMWYMGNEVWCESCCNNEIQPEN